MKEEEFFNKLIDATSNILTKVVEELNRFRTDNNEIVEINRIEKRNEVIKKCELKEPKNSLTKQYKRLFEFESVKLEFREDALAEIAKKAISKKTGARGLRSILESILLKTMFSLPDLENVDSVTVDKSVVKGKSDPILSYTKNKSTSAA